MSDKQNEKEVKGGLSRRGFLGASAVTGAAVAATAFGGAVMAAAAITGGRVRKWRRCMWRDLAQEKE